MAVDFPTPSLQVIDVTRLLKSNLYEDANAERRHKITVHSDWLVRFNNSIAAVRYDPNLYLMKYRVFYQVDSRHSMHDLLAVSSLRYEAYKQVWQEFAMEMDRLLTPDLFARIVTFPTAPRDYFSEFVPIINFAEQHHRPTRWLLSALTIYWLPLYLDVMRQYGEAPIWKVPPTWRPLVTPAYNGYRPHLDYLIVQSLLMKSSPRLLPSEFPYQQVQQAVDKILIAGFREVAHQDQETKHRGSQRKQKPKQEHQPPLGMLRFFVDDIYNPWNQVVPDLQWFTVREHAKQFVDWTFFDLFESSASSSSSDKTREIQSYLDDSGTTLRLSAQVGWSPNAKQLTEYRDTASASAFWHPYSVGWRYGSQAVGFALLNVTFRRDLQVTVLRDWLYQLYPVSASGQPLVLGLSEEGEESKEVVVQPEHLADARMLTSELGKDLIVEEERKKKKEACKFFLSSDCADPETGSGAMCLSAVWLVRTAEGKAESFDLRFDGSYDPNTSVMCRRNPQNPQRTEQPFYLPETGKVLLVAPEHYGRNWSIWQQQQYSDSEEAKTTALFASYQFLPHIVFQLVEVPPSSLSKQEESKFYCRRIRAPLWSSQQPLTETPFYMLDPLYTFQAGEYRFSLGSPALVYNDDEYLAVGHSRFNSSGGSSSTLLPSGTLSPIATRNWQSFLRRRQQQGLVPALYYYFMYLYTFDRRTFAIRRMSHSFIPAEHEPYWLVFPVGLSRLNRQTVEEEKGDRDDDGFLISYGEGDIRCKLLFLERTDMERLLQPIEDMVTDPEVHHFLQLEVPPPIQRHTTGRFSRTARGTKRQVSSSSALPPRKVARV